MINKAENLIWIDLEMTGLNPEIERIIEVGVVVTDSKFNVLDAGINLVLWQPDQILNAMDNWNTTHHSRSGLLAEVKASTLNEQEAEKKVLEFLVQFTESNTSPMCGNSVYQDRRFLNKYMPKLAAYFHYRNLDVSTLKILVQKFAPNLLKDQSKQSNHRAMNDILESIDEMKYYLDKCIKIG